MGQAPKCSLLSAFFLPSMETLSDMFELDLPTVHSIISKMIINEELMVRARVENGQVESWGVWSGGLGHGRSLPRSRQASLDQPTQTVVMHRTEPTAQQNLALQLAEKLGSLVENNERVFDHKQGTYGGYFRGQRFCPSALPGSWPPSRLFTVIHILLPSPLPCRPEGRLPQERGLHAPGRLPPAAISDSLLMASLLCLRPRPFSLSVVDHTPSY